MRKQTIEYSFIVPTLRVLKRNAGALLSALQRSAL